LGSCIGATFACGNCADEQGGPGHSCQFQAGPVPIKAVWPAPSSVWWLPPWWLRHWWVCRLAS